MRRATPTTTRRPPARRRRRSWAASPARPKAPSTSALSSRRVGHRPRPSSRRLSTALLTGKPRLSSGRHDTRPGRTSSRKIRSSHSWAVAGTCWYTENTGAEHGPRQVLHGLREVQGPRRADARRVREARARGHGALDLGGPAQRNLRAAQAGAEG